jgi:formate-dependent nitrite reductase membrane component NrfD
MIKIIVGLFFGLIGSFLIAIQNGYPLYDIPAIALLFLSGVMIGISHE